MFLILWVRGKWFYCCAWSEEREKSFRILTAVLLSFCFTFKVIYHSCILTVIGNSDHTLVLGRKLHSEDEKDTSIGWAAATTLPRWQRFASPLMHTLWDRGWQVWDFPLQQQPTLLFQQVPQRRKHRAWGRELSQQRLWRWCP